MKLDATEQMLNLVDEDGKPTAGGINRFERNWKLFENDTRPGTLEKLRPEIDAIRAMFLAGDRKGLVQQLTRTAPVRFKATNLSLGHAQVLNDMAGLALCCLEGSLDHQGFISPLRYNYQASFGQESGEAAAHRYFSLAGLMGAENKAEAEAIFKDKNPDDRALLARQEVALAEIRAALGIAIQ